MSKNLNLLLQGHSSFSPSKISLQNAQLNNLNDSQHFELTCLEYYAVSVDESFSDNSKLLNLLNAATQSVSPHFFIGPRAGTLSPWSSKTSEIIKNVGINGVQGIEKYFGYFVDGATEIGELFITNLFDRMTQDVFF